jgi:4-hydroxy-tetrahydrodipicolinate synthase
MPGRPADLNGVMTAILTPFDVDGRLALDLMPALLDFQRNAGIDGIVVCGTNGEGTSLSVAERKQTLESVMRHRGEFKVVAGTGATSITDALELTRHAADLGADAALLLPPFFYKQPPTEGLAAYFLALMDAAELPVLLYNIPQMTAVPITDALLDRLASHSRLAGIKDSAGDWERTHALITQYPRLQTYAGSDYLAARCLRAGGAGCVSGGANPFPEVVAAVRDACLSGDARTVDAAQARLDAMLDILVRYPFVAASKSVLARRGLPRTGVRPSLVNLSPSQEDTMLGEFRAAGFLD